MDGREPDLRLVVTIEGGLIDEDMALGPAVVVEVAPHRRNAQGWPSRMIGALVVSPEMLDGVAAVWAAGEEGEPIVPAGGAARELWRPAVEIDLDELPRYPEAESARRSLPERA